MKIFKPFLILFTPILLSSCFSVVQIQDDSPKEDKTEQVINHSYDEVGEYRIFWNDIFKQPFDLYYVYLYSPTCAHCNSIKNEMIEYVLGDNQHLFFISSSAEHNISDNVNPNQHIDSLENLYIKGYPTLLKLTEKVVTKNIAGVKEIKQELSLYNSQYIH